MSSPSDISKHVESLLQKQPEASKFSLHVKPELTRLDGGWYYVVVSVGSPGMRAYDFVDVLARVEKEARQQTPQLLVLPASGV